MRIQEPTMLAWTLTVMLCSSGALTGCAAERDSRPPDALRQEIRELNARADELQADGREAEAREVRRRADELRQQAGRQTPRRIERDGPDARADLPRERERLMNQLEELRRDGKKEEAAEVQRRIQRIERVMEEQPMRGRPSGPAQRDFRGPQPSERAIGGEPGRPEDMRNRRHHVEVALEHLRAAGLHDVAEHLARELDRRFEGRPGDGESDQPMERVGAELRRLRAEMEELRAQMRQMHAEKENRPREGR